jgi:hypothetical protein
MLYLESPSGSSEESMWMSKNALAIASLILATLVVVSAGPGAMALSKQIKGKWNCSCSGGSGTCTVYQKDNTVECQKTSDDTCTGSCEMSTTTTGVGGAVMLKGTKSTTTTTTEGAAQ